MLGWNIRVYRQQSEAKTPASARAGQGALVAAWQTGLDGIDWLRDLVTQEKAISLGGNGYPFEFTATTEQLKPRILEGPPDVKQLWTYEAGDTFLPGWLGRSMEVSQSFDVCEPGEWLLIQAWDES